MSTFNHPEYNGPLPLLYNRRLLITGGSHGTGFAIGENAVLLGADVILGSRTGNSFDKADNRMQMDNVCPFIADFKNPKEVKKAIRWLVKNDLIPTDIILSAAAGLDVILNPVGRKVVRLAKMQGEGRASGLVEIQEEIRKRIEANYPTTLQINSESNKTLIEELGPYLGANTRIIFLSSLPSDLYGEVKTPNIYEGVARSKHDFIRYLSWKGPELARRQIYSAVVSGNLLLDTVTAQTLIKLGKMLPDVVAISPNLNLPTTKDMAVEVERILLDDPRFYRFRRVPYRRYVIGPGPAEDYLSPKDPRLNQIIINL